MAKPELGLKRTCVECSARFYDLNRVPAVCPKCGTTQPDDSRLKRSEVPLPEEKDPKPQANEHEDDVDLEVAEDEDDDDVIAPDDDLDDDDDLSNDIEVPNDKDDRDDN
ncbi:MAG: TIGR02300 family protein [Gluconobacter potus]|uniref:TIGR02300 family protein n=3 Tax=Gluconobacter TaxID=441 RepID=A0ABR9YI76_9PROT|nr:MULTISPECIES: TIGR02300 family protein [Gluconobacter]KXV44488.1 hypothetical protein AD943_03160 [Gluconobacter roseus]MBF0858967.1 TIGR02300 family protein [Gluconobacter vitians]MBF0863566.1 TIGR02300 family protein [Gluconobacter sp. R71656]MBF0866373.1 TIGR02300 family protein [Gluconobacter sp. R75628]MBF0872499.1 TIGR02300 family protein [Gluconobacter sp. R75629]